MYSALSVPLARSSLLPRNSAGPVAHFANSHTYPRTGCLQTRARLDEEDLASQGRRRRRRNDSGLFHAPVSCKRSNRGRRIDDALTTEYGRDGKWPGLRSRSLVLSTEKIKVQRLLPSIPSVRQGGGCGITLFGNCANRPHKTFPKRTLLS